MWSSAKMVATLGFVMTVMAVMTVMTSGALSFCVASWHRVIVPSCHRAIGSLAGAGVPLAGLGGLGAGIGTTAITVGGRRRFRQRLKSRHHARTAGGQPHAQSADAGVAGAAGFGAFTSHGTTGVAGLAAALGFEDDSAAGAAGAAAGWTAAGCSRTMMSQSQSRSGSGNHQHHHGSGGANANASSGLHQSDITVEGVETIKRQIRAAAHTAWGYGRIDLEVGREVEPRTPDDRRHASRHARRHASHTPVAMPVWTYSNT